jgi:hypothetical protein
VLIRYVLSEEQTADRPTIWILRSLTYGQVGEVTALKVEGQILEADILTVDYGLVGWQDFTDESSQPLVFSPETVFRVPPRATEELAEVLWNISHLDDDIREDLVALVRASEFVSEAKTPDIWDCEYCVAHNLQTVRKCPDEIMAVDDLAADRLQRAALKADKYGIRRPGEADVRSVLEYRGYRFTSCPVSSRGWVAEFLYGLVVRCDNMQVLPGPGGYLGQENTYVQASDIIGAERNKIERHKHNEEDSKTKGKRTTGDEFSGVKNPRVGRKSLRR